MQCGRLLHRSVLTGCNEASWTALRHSQLQSCWQNLQTSTAPSAAVCSLFSRLLNTQRRLNQRTLPHPRNHRRSPSTIASRNERRGRVDPTYTPHDPSIHSASTHPPLHVLYGSFHPSSSFAVIYKPANLSVSSLPPADSVERRLREGWSGVSGRRRVWFPHRLDKHTEGVMVVVFDGLLNARMGREIAEKRWTKRYRLIGQLPHSLPALTLTTADEKGAEEGRDSRQSGSAEQKKGKEVHDRRLSKIRCSHLRGELFTTGGLLPSGLLSSHLTRRPPPPPATTIDYKAEEQHWATDLTTHYTTSPSTSTHSHSPHRRIHPFVPETMLYYSVAGGGGGVGVREAVSRYRLLDVDEERRQAMWEAELLTGRSHQLRVHWSDAGCPIVNDPYYNHQYVWQQVQQEKQRRAGMTAGGDEQKRRVDKGEVEQVEERMDRSVILVRRMEEAERKQSMGAEEGERGEEGQRVGDDELHSADVDRPTAARAAASSTTVIHRPPLSRLTPLGPSYRILPPAQSRGFSTQQWQSVLDKYGVKSASEGISSRRRGLQSERGVVDDVESMAELREAEEEESIKQMIAARRQRKESRKNKQQRVEELDMDDIRAMEEDEVELYPTSTTATTATNARPTHSTSPTTHLPSSPIIRPPTHSAAAVDNPLASAGWLAMSSPNIRSPFATTSHGMRLQSYYLSMPHPTRADYELTVVVPLPAEWTSSGGQRWSTAESEWQQWQFRAQKQNSLGRFRWLGREKQRKTRRERSDTKKQTATTTR